MRSGNDDGRLTSDQDGGKGADFAAFAPIYVAHNSSWEEEGGGGKEPASQRRECQPKELRVTEPTIRDMMRCGFTKFKGGNRYKSVSA